jgi:hypothetical protein
VLSTLRFFGEEYQAFIEGGPSYARKMSRGGASAAAPAPRGSGATNPPIATPAARGTGTTTAPFSGGTAS